jgi:hypothetical protein
MGGLFSTELAFIGSCQFMQSLRHTHQLWGDLEVLLGGESQSNVENPRPVSTAIMQQDEGTGSVHLHHTAES